MCAAHYLGKVVLHTHQWRLRLAKAIVDSWEEDLVALGATDDGFPAGLSAAAAGGLAAGTAGTDSISSDDKALGKKGKLKALKLRKSYFKRKAAKAKRPSDRLKYQAALIECRSQLRAVLKVKKKKAKKGKHNNKKEKARHSESSDASLLL